MTVLTADQTSSELIPMYSSFCCHVYERPPNSIDLIREQDLTRLEYQNVVVGDVGLRSLLQCSICVNICASVSYRYIMSEISNIKATADTK